MYSAKQSSHSYKVNYVVTPSSKSIIKAQWLPARISFLTPLFPLSLSSLLSWSHSSVQCSVLVFTLGPHSHSLIIASKYGTAGSPAQGRALGASSQSEEDLGPADQSEAGEQPALAHHGVIPLQQNTIKYCVPQKVRIWTLDSDYEASRGRKTKTDNFPQFCEEGARVRKTWIGSNGLSVSWRPNLYFESGVPPYLLLLACCLIHFVDCCIRSYI